MADIPFDEDVENPVESVRTFADEGVLTQNKGLVVKVHDGSEYQVTRGPARRPTD